jgi:hypothetical protein
MLAYAGVCTYFKRIERLPSCILKTVSCYCLYLKRLVERVS